MTLDEIEQAAGQHLDGMDSTPIAWPNKDFTPEGTYLEFRHAPTSVEDPVISGGFEYELGLFLITAVIPSGSFTSEANALAEQVRRHFPKALRLTAGDGNVVINQPPNFGTPFQDGSNWRQPVTVSYITEPVPETPTVTPGQMDFSDPDNSGLIVLARFAGVADTVGQLDFSQPAQSGLLAAI